MGLLKVIFCTHALIISGVAVFTYIGLIKINKNKFKKGNNLKNKMKKINLTHKNDTGGSFEFG